jgi:hypothetical protein
VLTPPVHVIASPPYPLQPYGSAGRWEGRDRCHGATRSVEQSLSDPLESEELHKLLRCIEGIEPDGLSLAGRQRTREAPHIP